MVRARRGTRGVSGGRRSRPPRRPSCLSAGDSLEQLLTLLVAEPAHPAVVVDSGLLHQGGGLGRAVAGHSLDDLGDLGLLRYVVMLGEHLRDRQLSGLYRGQQLTALLTGGLCLRERLGSLLRGQCRQSHVTPSVEWTNCPTDSAQIAVTVIVSGQEAIFPGQRLLHDRLSDVHADRRPSYRQFVPTCPGTASLFYFGQIVCSASTRSGRSRTAWTSQLETNDAIPGR